MARNSRDDGLSYKAIFVNGKPIRRNLLRPTWTKLARACYERGCNCTNCDLIPKKNLDSLYKCQVKYYVMGYIKLGYQYKESEENDDNT